MYFPNGILSHSRTIGRKNIYVATDYENMADGYLVQRLGHLYGKLVDVVDIINACYAIQVDTINYCCKPITC